MAAGFSAEVKGIRELVASLGQLDSATRRELRAVGRRIAEDAARRAVEHAESQGFGPPGRSGQGSGKLVRSIKPAAPSSRGYVAGAAIREDAKNERTGYPYPLAYEFGKAARWNRPFLYPAVEEERVFVLAEVTAAVNRAVGQAF